MRLETDRERIISCYGYLTAKSVAKIFKVSTAYVIEIWDGDGCYEGESNREL